MYDIENLSFQELGNRELLKDGTYWLGMIAVISAAAYAYASGNS